MAPHTAAAAHHKAQAAPTLQQCAAAPILDRDSKRASDEIEQQAWHAYINGLPSGAQPRFCKDCSNNSFLDAECRAVISEIDPVLGPRRAKCRDARKSDGACSFAAKLFAYPAIGIHGAATVAASTPLDADLHPLDSELAIEIRAMFLTHWNMDSAQADARMAQFNYGHAIAALPVPAPGAIGSAFGGGIYAGIGRGVDGGPDQHLVLIDGEAEAVTWEGAVAWATNNGASLPTRAEQRLLLANLPDQFKPDWYWSGEQAGPSNAWVQSFGYGDQNGSNRSYEGRARAVRRFPI